MTLIGYIYCHERCNTRRKAFFTNLTDAEWLEIGRETSNVDSYVGWIKGGSAAEWTKVVEKGKKDARVDYTLMAAHALGMIDVVELSTALIYIDFAMHDRVGCKQLSPKGESFIVR